MVMRGGIVRVEKEAERTENEKRATVLKRVGVGGDRGD